MWVFMKQPQLSVYGFVKFQERQVTIDCLVVDQIAPFF